MLSKKDNPKKKKKSYIKNESTQRRKMRQNNTYKHIFQLLYLVNQDCQLPLKPVLAISPLPIRTHTCKNDSQRPHSEKGPDKKFSVNFNNDS